MKSIFTSIFNYIFNKRKKLHTYVVTYINGAMVDDKNMIFDRKWTEEAIVEANDIMDAGVEFAKKHVLYPHVCIDRITKFM